MVWVAPRLDGRTRGRAISVPKSGVLENDGHGTDEVWRWWNVRTCTRSDDPFRYLRRPADSYSASARHAMDLCHRCGATRHRPSRNRRTGSSRCVAACQRPARCASLCQTTRRLSPRRRVGRADLLGQPPQRRRGRAAALSAVATASSGVARVARELIRATSGISRRTHIRYITLDQRLFPASSSAGIH
eukprot:COSAG02_NODE_38_length_48090_cov_107.207060_11_plen_189_part_00